MRPFQASLCSVAGQNKVKSLYIVPMNLCGSPLQQLCIYKISQNTTVGLNLNANAHQRVGFFSVKEPFFSFDLQNVIKSPREFARASRTC